MPRSRAGKHVGPLAGVPFAVKNLFDVAGLPTRAGSKINRDLTPPPRDATLIARLEAAGAVLVGALNMGEYAYDFTGENVHDGPSRNPHDITRMTGGSSGGSGGAVGGGLVPLALGSDTNGSIRVPSSFCGIFGLKPTYGRLSRARSFPFVAQLRSSRAVRALRRAIWRWPTTPCRVPIADDAACTDAAGRAGDAAARRRTSAGCASPSPAAISRQTLFPEALEAVARVAKALGATRVIEIPEAARARAAAYVITTRRRRVAASRPAAPAAARFRSGGARPAAGRRHGARAAGRPRAEIPPLVSRPGAGAVQDRRHHPRAGDALRGAEDSAR